jgi:hypothetical protein
MPPPREGRAKAAGARKPQAGSAFRWVRLLIVAAVALAVVQLFLHSHPPAAPAHLEASRRTDGPPPAAAAAPTAIPSADAPGGAAVAVTAARLLKDALETVTAQLRASETKAARLAEAVSSLETQLRDERRTPAIPRDPGLSEAAAAALAADPPLLPPPPAASAASAAWRAPGDGFSNESRSQPDLAYSLRAADCGLILGQRRRIAGMDEEWAFVKYDRGKVPTGAPEGMD